MKISLPKQINSKFGASIAHLVVDILAPLHKHIVDENGPVVVDVSPCEFITPLIATPLAVLQNRYWRLKKDFVVYCDEGAKFSQYAKTIRFPGGFLPELVPNGDYDKALHVYHNKSYIPILNFPAQRSAESNQIRESVLQALHNLLNQQLNLSTNFRTGVTYLIDELVNNIKDHSEAERGFIFAQYYSSPRYLDVCIADDGIGILGAYHKHGIIQYTSSAQAIRGAVSGVSTKNEAGGRGFGIPTSLRMLVDGMGGNFLLMSGNANLLRTVGRDDINELPDTITWPGTLVGLRIPFTQKTFDYKDYLE